MKHGMRNGAALLAFLAFAAVSALTVSAQTLVGQDELRDSRPVYSPESATSGATMGLITADTDRFLSALDFGALSAQNWFAYGGVDEKIKDGINFGFGTKIGANKKGYFGVAYSGNLINEVVGLFTNQSAAGFKMETVNNGTTTGPALVDADGTPVSDGEYLSNHNLHFLLGGGVFAFKFGFAEYIKGNVTVNQTASELESSLQPSIELGLNAGGFKFALRGAADFHQFEKSVTTPTTQFNQVNFFEPSGGVTIGLNFSRSEKTLAELDIIADGIYRIYGFLGDMPEVSTRGAGTAVDVSGILDLRTTGSLGFTYRTELNEQFTLGFNAKVGGGYDILSLSTEPSGGGTKIDSKYTSLTVTPDVSAAVTYSPWKDHFALHAGLGLQLFSIDMITDDSGITPGGNPGDTITSTVVEVPTVRLGVGTTVNFTENTALDLLIATRNIADITNAKFTMLFSVKK
ncbi:hypothetical protein FACS1894147_10610 [Spirochaetia bacterium]|nr:hypothetical protein FACS1894147_10610 [Spirochaetia bacterium]